MRTRQRVLIAVFSSVVLVAVVITSLVPIVGSHLQDLQVYRLGGRAVLGRQPLYAQRTGAYGFTYPPVAALLAVPFAALPFGAASAALAGGSLISLAVVLRHGAGELIAWLRAAPSVWALSALVALACCAPVRGTFWNGQVNLLLAALVLADVSGRRFGGAGVGLAAAIKLTPAIFALYLLVCGRRREAAHAAISFGAVTALAWVLLPADSARYWLHQVFAGSGGSAGIGDEARTSNQSLHGLALRMFGTSPAGAVWLPLAAIAMVVGLGIARRLTRDGREMFAIGVVGVTGCVASPLSWVHHWVWAIPWLVGMARAVRGPAMAVWVGLVSVVVVGWDQLPLNELRAWAPLTFLGQNDLVLCAVATGVACLIRPHSPNRPAQVPTAKARVDDVNSG